MSPLRLSGPQMREVRQAAQMVPYDLRAVFWERVAAELRGKEDLGDGLVHRTAYAVAPGDHLDRWTYGGGKLKVADIEIGSAGPYRKRD